MADTFAHPGRNGVSVRIPRAAAPDDRPRFTCAVEGSTIRIDSTNTARLWVEAGDQGLGLAGEIAILWNGKEACRGPAKRVERPVEAGRKRDGPTF